MRHSISKEKINILNGLLANQKRQIDKKLFIQSLNQDQGLQNRHQFQRNPIMLSKVQRQVQANSHSAKKQLKDMDNSRSRLLLKSEAKSKIEDIDELMCIELKPESKVINRQKSTHFKKYEFKSQQLPTKNTSNQISLVESKIINHANQSTSTSKQRTKRLVDVNHDIVKKYFATKINKMTSLTQASQIYQIVYPLYELCAIILQYPLVKLYRNCVYFGEHSKSRNQLYEGILIFYQKKRLYYGQFLNQKKHGYGIQIDFNDNSVYIGRCDKGQKIDEFQVIKSNQVYKGPIVNFLYEGYGQLKTKWSIYKGYFSKGQRHGEGKQYFPGTGLVIAGTFIHNLFSNDQEEIAKSRSKDMRKSNANRMKLNPQQSMSDFNYEFDHGIKRPSMRKQASEANSFRVKMKGHIKRQQIDRKISISEEDRLYNINNRYWQCNNIS